MELQEVAGKEFLVGLRGYVKEDVRVYLRAVSDELFRREALIVDLRAKLEEAYGDLAETNRRLEEANRRPEGAGGAAQPDRPTLIKLVGEEAAAILVTADRAAEQIRSDAERQAESVRDGLLSTRGQLVQLHQSLGQLLDDIETMEDERYRPPVPVEADVTLLGPGSNGARPGEEIRLRDGAAMPGTDGESGWSWAG